MDASIDVVLTPHSIGLIRPDEENLHVPSQGNFFQAYHAWQQKENNYLPIQLNDPEFEQPRLSMPAPVALWGCRLGPTSDYQQIHPSWQFRYLELFRLMVGSIPADGEVEYWYTGGEGSKPYKKVPAGTLHANPRFVANTLLSAYSQVFEDHRALTDGAAFNTENGWYRDDVMKCHQENPRTWRHKCLGFKGSIYQEHPNPPGIVPPDKIAIKAWDITKPAPSLSVILAPDSPPLIWGSEQSVEKLQDEHGNLVLWSGRPSYKVAHYPYLKLVCRKYGLMPEVGTPFFTIGIGGWNLINKTDVYAVQNGSKYNPYWP